VIGSQERQYTRRDLLSRTLLCGGGGALTALLAACGSAATTTTSPAATVAQAGGATAPTATVTKSSSTPASTSAATAATPSVGGSNGKTIAELRIAVAALPEGMDPLEPSSNVFNRVNYSCFDYLIRLDYANGGKLTPMLAMSWQRIDDRTLEVTLRQGVKFQDGAPFTADDVVYSFNRIITNKDPKLGQANPNFFPFASVEKLDDFRVRFVGTGTDPIIERRLATPGAQIIHAKYHQQVGAAEFRVKPLATGPYRLTELVVGERITFEANRDYWGGAPAAQKVTFRVVPEVATRIAAVTNGEVELITNVPPDQIAALQGRKNLVVKSKTLTNVHMLYYNGKMAPFDKPAIRQAVNYAIDRKTLIDALWLGNATQMHGLQFEGEDLYNANRPVTAYDPEKAKALLKEGGYAGEPITYVAASPNYYTNEREVGEAIMGMWQQVGINGKLLLTEQAQKTKAYSTAHVTTISATSFVGDPEGYVWQPLGPDGTQQKNGYWTPAGPFNQLGQEVRSTLDSGKRAASFQQMLDIFEKEAPGTILYAPQETYAMAANIGWEPYSYYYLDLRPYNFSIK
jgi:peptide/nickel transport system substrate-binding protein